MFRTCVSAGTTPRRAFASAGLVVCIAAAVIAMPASAANAAVTAP